MDNSPVAFSCLSRVHPIKVLCLALLQLMILFRVLFRQLLSQFEHRVCGWVVDEFSEVRHLFLEKRHLVSEIFCIELYLTEVYLSVFADELKLNE